MPGRRRSRSPVWIKRHYLNEKPQGHGFLNPLCTASKVKGWFKERLFYGPMHGVN
jgi:hypothetical protein